MTVTINIDIEKARKTLIMSAGSLEEANIYKNMSPEEIKDKVLQHCKCWSIEEEKYLEGLYFYADGQMYDMNGDAAIEEEQESSEPVWFPMQFTDLDKIKEEIEKQEMWLSIAGYNAYNVDIAFNAIKAVLEESEVEE